MKNILIPGCLTAMLLFGIGTLNTHAALTGPQYPAQGGNLFSSSGSAGLAGGATLSYSGFNPSAFSQLYWGPSAYGAIDAGLSQGGGVMSFVGISGLTATWTGTASYLAADPFLNVKSVTTTFTATVDSAATPWVLASSVSLAAGLGALVNDSSGLNYNVTVEFFANGTPIDQFSTLYDHGGSDHTDLNGGFYYAAPVPEPTTMLAGALLLLPIGARTLRILRKRQVA